LTPSEAPGGPAWELDNLRFEAEEQLAESEALTYAASLVEDSSNYSSTTEEYGLFYQSLETSLSEHTDTITSLGLARLNGDCWLSLIRTPQFKNFLQNTGLVRLSHSYNVCKEGDAFADILLSSFESGRNLNKKKSVNYSDFRDYCAAEEDGDSQRLVAVVSPEGLVVNVHSMVLKVNEDVPMFPFITFFLGLCSEHPGIAW